MHSDHKRAGSLFGCEPLGQNPRVYYVGSLYRDRERDVEVKERSSLVTPIDLFESVLGGKDG